MHVQGTGPFVLDYNGIFRTVTTNMTIDHDDYRNYTFDPTFDYKLCNSIEESINGQLYIELEDGSCVKTQNPKISLDGYEDSVTADIFDLHEDNLTSIDEWWSGGEELVFVLQASLWDNPSFSTICSSLPSVPEIGDDPIYAKISSGSWLMFDPRLDLETNTVQSPIPDGGKEAFAVSGGETYCSNVPQTFLNENECQLSANACQPSTNSDIDILLENSTIAAINRLTGRYVYAIKGLLVQYGGEVLSHPCTPGLRSRWEPKNLTDCNPTDIYSGTNLTLSGLLSSSGDRNPYMRDIYFPNEGANCNITDTNPQIEIEVDGTCWKRVHDDHMSLFDVSATLISFY